ncbi:type II secretion system protein GspM [Succinimonas amylolytica]|uniref:type II secretion system protein GspM n=1 Tax=Succinimonas amylolytica TaxID=83769 RepID=UPI00036C7E75|nr:type II secretion system protein GspM [Succinimonas amylolytica]
MKDRLLSYYRSRTYREKMVLGLLLAMIILMVFFSLLIYPKVRDVRKAEMALEGAKSGYSFLLTNASRVTPGSQGVVNSSTSVRAAADNLLRTAKITRYKLRAQGDNKADVEIESAVPFSGIIQALSKLESDYGITVDDISIDKQGDGLVYVSRLSLIRLTGEEE